MIKNSAIKNSAIKNSANSLAFAVIFFIASIAHADLSCIKISSKNGKIATSVKTVTTPKCPKGFIKVIDTASLIGPQGPSGSNGQDGQRLIYGNGVAGERVISVSETLGADAFPDNDSILEFTNFTVNNGVVLTVPSGTIIRTTGTFTNNGTISISQGARGSIRFGSSGAIALRYTASNPGIALSAAGDSELGDNTSSRIGGTGGRGLSEFQARQIRYPSSSAGGGGGVADNGSNGASGGGSLVVISQGTIINTGTITANGENADFGEGGGGGGGVVILASKISVTHSAAGTISAKGGDGIGSDSDQGASAGGGGGIIHFISPTVVNAGFSTVAGGSAGTAGAAGSVSNTVRRAGGGGGGACGGNGGSGGSVTTGGDPAIASSATSGYVLTSLLDPTGSF